MPLLTIPGTPPLAVGGAVEESEPKPSADSAVGHLAFDLERPPSGDPGSPLEEICVLYCHGFASRRGGQKAAYFRQLFLDSGLAFCAFDFRGHGESSGTLFELTLSRNLEDIAFVRAHLESLGFRRFVLFGSSMGGGTCAWYASRNPAGIAALILLAPSLEMDVGLLRRLGPERARLWQESGSTLFEHELGAHELSWGTIEDLRRYDRRLLAQDYRSPTLVLQGMADDSVDWRSTLDFVSSCDGAAVQLHLMSEGDHRLVDRLPLLWGLVSVYLQSQGIVHG